MGGRGSSSGGGGGGTTGGNVNVLSETSLISAREGKRSEVDQSLSVLRDIKDRYGVEVEDAQVVRLDAKNANVMAYYDAAGNLAVNETYFDSKKMNAAYDRCVDSGFHPPRGNKTGLEATVAHEMGHRLTDVAGVKAGNGAWNLDATSNSIVKEAMKATGSKSIKEFRAKISGYAKQSNAEAIAEAFSDVYCNGKKAKKESQAVVNALNKYF